MKLTSAARALLRQDPNMFLSRYGSRYISSIAYGGSFVGSVAVIPKETADDSDLQALPALCDLSEAGSAHFMNVVPQLDVSVSISASWVGGALTGNFSSPWALNNTLSDWTGSVSANPAPLTLTFRSWIDSTEVQEILPFEYWPLFNAPYVTGALQGMISEEHASVVTTDISVKQALTWRELPEHPSAKACLTGLGRDVSSKLMRIGQLTEATMLEIQSQWLAGDWSWFEAEDLRHRYSQCVAPL